ncbi:MAG: cobalamin-dependent protein [Lachnospiraceae bacterium]|nr:cobalamin-dependent protein [Lachnospiraceae bacterium]
MIDCNALAEAMGELDEDAVVSILNEVMDDGGAEAQDAMTACQKGMDIVGSRFEEGEYFVGDLIYAGELMTEAVGILKDALVTDGDGEGSKTKMILCTVKDDLHDIGKNIVKAMLEAAGFEVIDLGIDVPPEMVVKAVAKDEIKIVALSGVLTLAIDSMKNTIEALKQAGMSDVKVIIGGAPVSQEAMDITGADEWAHSPQKTVNTCKAWALELGA